MAHKNQPPPGPVPPAPQAKKKPSFGGYYRQEATDFAEHAEEIRNLVAGQDTVEQRAPAREKPPPAFDREALQVVRSWVKSRPLEPTSNASALIAYPRRWSQKRGRYSNFSLPGSGTVGLLRARPTW